MTQEEDNPEEFKLESLSGTSQDDMVEEASVEENPDNERKSSDSNDKNIKAEKKTSQNNPRKIIVLIAVILLGMILILIGKNALSNNTSEVIPDSENSTSKKYVGKNPVDGKKKKHKQEKSDDIYNYKLNKKEKKEDKRSKKNKNSTISGKNESSAPALEEPNISKEKPGESIDPSKVATNYIESNLRVFKPLIISESEIKISKKLKRKIRISVLTNKQAQRVTNKNRSEYLELRASGAAKVLIVVHKSKGKIVDASIVDLS